MIYQIINVEPPRPSQFRSDLPPRIEAIVMRALQKNVAERYATWEEFAHDLVVALGSEHKLETGFAESEKFDTLRKLDFFRSSATSSCGRYCGSRRGASIPAIPC
jgi:serine/threonine protein kinase